MRDIKKEHIRFNALWQKHHKLIMYLALSYARYDEELGKDYSQEVALAILVNIDRLSENANRYVELKWIMKVVRSTLTNHGHKDKIDLVPLKEEILEKYTEESNPNSEQLKELTAYLGDKEIQLIQYIIDGFSYKEIAMIEETTESAIKVRVHRIKSKLKEINNKIQLL